MWQPCELLYTCYLLTYLRHTPPRPGPTNFQYVCVLHAMPSGNKADPFGLCGDVAVSEQPRNSAKRSFHSAAPFGASLSDAYSLLHVGVLLNSAIRARQDPTGPARTLSETRTDQRSFSEIRAVRVREGPRGSGRARVVEFSQYQTKSADFVWSGPVRSGPVGSV